MWSSTQKVIFVHICFPHILHDRLTLFSLVCVTSDYSSCICRDNSSRVQWIRMRSSVGLKCKTSKCYESQFPLSVLALFSYYRNCSKKGSSKKQQELNLFQFLQEPLLNPHIISIFQSFRPFSSDLLSHFQTGAVVVTCRCGECRVRLRQDYGVTLVLPDPNLWTLNSECTPDLSLTLPRMNQVTVICWSQVQVRCVSSGVWWRRFKCFLETHWDQCL